MIIPLIRRNLGYLIVLSFFFLKNGLVIIDGNQLFSNYTAGVKTRGNGPQLQCVGFRLNIGKNWLSGMNYYGRIWNFLLGGSLKIACQMSRLI